MIDSASVRRENTKLIQRVLRSGNKFTKQNIASETKLSVATCNTILNELEACGEVIGEKLQLGSVGRSSMVYVINEAYESILCLEFQIQKGRRILTYTVLSTIKNVLKHEVLQYDLIDYNVVSQIIEDLMMDFPNISRISIGTPSIAQGGCIKHCDIAELNDEPIVQKLQARFGIPIVLENDMHLKVYGYYKWECKKEDTVTIANFMQHLLPGTGTVSQGSVIKGANQFAGMVGFLPYGISREDELKLLAPNTYLPYAVKALTSIIAIINPKVILLTGDLINEEDTKKIEQECREYIPDEYIPHFIYVENTDVFYLEGMFQRALELEGE